MRLLILPFTSRFITLTVVCLAAVGLTAANAAAAHLLPGLVVPWILTLALVGLGVHDLLDTRHAVLRNYPLAAHLRYILEGIRPAMRQYFFEDEKHGKPFSRDERAVVYQRAKMVLDKRPFGTQHEVYSDGFEWLNHSMVAREPARDPFRVDIGGPDCGNPYIASVLNISAMSFGALSPQAIRALNCAARDGGFAQDTGEGGVSPHHLQGGDLIWEIGSGYFGARTAEGQFCPARFADAAANPLIRMVELKLSQGAKPGHGGVLLAAKVSAEIAAIRGVPQGQDCISPSRHSAFSTPLELIRFVAEMRRLAGGKPAGIKLCIGQEWEFMALCKAMLETGEAPDFMVIDGAEGGTGAAPLEFMDHMGKPLREGLSFAHSALVGAGLRHKIRLGASGKIVTAFDMARAYALGADWCNSARGFMLALGCIQSLSCHTDRCPTGVATQDPTRARALHVPSKAERAVSFHAATLQTLAELIAAAGLHHPAQLTPAHFQRRVSACDVRSFAELYPCLREGELIEGAEDARFALAWRLADAKRFVQA
jgi:glutamate synthase domain-containing protein 2